MSGSFKNFQEQQKRMREQQDQQNKLWQDYLRRQQMYAHYQDLQQQKKAGDKGFYSCSVCGSASGLKACPICKKFFCGVHLPIVKTALGGHACVLSQPPSGNYVKPGVSLTTTKSARKAQGQKLVDLNHLVDWFSKLAKDIPLSEEQDLLFNYLLARLRRFPDDSLDWLDWLQEYDYKT